MKLIGYIFRYSEKERKGILVFGHEEGPNWTKPVLFRKSDCISIVETGNLVYFNLTKSGKANKIEKASFLNIRKDVLDNVISNGIDNKNQAFLLYENISDLYVDEQRKYFDSFLEETFGTTAGTNKVERFRFIYEDPDLYKNIELPNDINGLYSLFGNKTDYEDLFYDDTFDHTVKIEILDIKYWFEKGMVKDKDYCIKTAEQVLYLFNIFENKREYFSPPKPGCGIGKDNSILDIWKYILSKLNHAELKKIYEKEPRLQPALPRNFCLKNLDLLSLDFKFRTPSVCEQYFKYRINNALTATEFILLKGNVRSLSLSKKIVNELQLMLEERYKNQIISNIKRKLTEISGNEIYGENRVRFLVYDNEQDYLLKIGSMLDIHDRLSEKDKEFESIKTEYEIIKKYLSIFLELLPIDRKELENVVKEIIREYILKNARKGKAGITILYIDEFGYHIGIQMCDVIEEIKTISNNKFAETHDIWELNYAFSNNLITEEQHYKRYKSLTENFAFTEILDIVLCNRFERKSLLVQEYLLSKLFHDFHSKTLFGHNYVKYYDITIWHLKDLIDICKEKAEREDIDKEVWEKVLNEVKSKLSEEDRLLLENNDKDDDNESIPF